MGNRVRRTYEYRLHPTKQQAETIDKAINTCRWLHNEFLVERKRAWENERQSVTKVDQLNRLPALKREKPDLKAVYSQVLQDVSIRLDKAYQNFFRRVKNGENPGFPRFKATTAITASHIRKAISCIVEPKPFAKTGKAVGIDVGVADFVITSDGEFFPKLDKYRQAEKRLKYLQRMVSRLRSPKTSPCINGAWVDCPREG